MFIFLVLDISLYYKNQTNMDIKIKPDMPQIIEKLKSRIFNLYGIDIESVKVSKNGAGSLIFFIAEKEQKYVVKYADENEMNNPVTEPQICAHLLKKGIPMCRFIKNKQGNAVSRDENGRVFHVQRFIDGKVYDYNQAPDWLMSESAITLAKIHVALKDFSPLPVGIGGDFFKRKTPVATLKGYRNTLETALTNGDLKIAEEIRLNMQILERFPSYDFDINRFTCLNTHGDFTVSQIICGDNRINGVIDWTTACVHPVVWEIIRSYVYASPLCANGGIDINDFTDYVRTYLLEGKLNSYDLENMAQMFFYFTAVCNFYGQYYNSSAVNRNIYLQQATLSSKLLRWFDKNALELRIALRDLAPAARLDI